MRNLGIAFAITLAGVFLWWRLLNIMHAHDIITGADGFWYFSVSFVLVFVMLPVAAVVMGIKRPVRWKKPVDVGAARVRPLGSREGQTLVIRSM